MTRLRLWLWRRLAPQFGENPEIGELRMFYGQPAMLISVSYNATYRGIAEVLLTYVTERELAQKDG